MSAPVLVHLNPGVTFAQAFGAVESHHGDPNALNGLASIVYSVEHARGTQSEQTRLPAGGYVALDTTNNNPAKWPRAAFTVISTSSPATLPAPAATFRAIEFRFRGPGTLHRGQAVRFENDGYLVHMIDWVKVKNAKDASKVMALLLAGKDNKVQKLGQGFGSFQGGVSGGALQQYKLAAKPGLYVVACFMSTQDGREHTRLGMERTIRVK